MRNDDDAGLTWYEKKRGLTASKKKRINENKIRGQKLALKETRTSKENSDGEKKSGPHSSMPRRNATVRGAGSGHPRGMAVSSHGSLFDINSLPKECAEVLDEFQSIVFSAYPLGSKQIAKLPHHIKELSHLLTDERGERRLGYMNRTETLSAYVHYFMWWNLVRLTRLFANIEEDFFSIPEDSICLDIGSGPLTVPIALFLSRPDLRRKKLTWYCMDISQQALSAGENIFLSVAAKLQCEPWKIIRIKGSPGIPVRQKAAFVTCANMFNEAIDEAGVPPDFLAKKHLEKILTYTEKNTRLLIIEPGVPKSARFLSLMRDAMLRKKFTPCSPCPHTGACPMSGERGKKWCNYAFSTEDAPEPLRKLSEKSGLPKERAVLSFIAAKTAASPEKNSQGAKSGGSSGTLTFRIASDPIALPKQRTGYYACSEQGLLLVVTHENLFSGQCCSLTLPHRPLSTDQKSGALILELD